MFIFYSNKSIQLRIDTGTGRGHHQHVKTAGELSKFGIPLTEIEHVAALAKKSNIKVVGLHAHVGSGILKETGNWKEVGETLASCVLGNAVLVKIFDSIQLPMRDSKSSQNYYFWKSLTDILFMKMWDLFSHEIFSLIPLFPDVTYLNLGGGFGVVYNPAIDVPLNLEVVAKDLDQFKKEHPNLNLWVEPGLN